MLNLCKLYIGVYSVQVFHKKRQAGKSKSSNILILTYCKHHAVSNEKYVRERYKKRQSVTA